MAEKRALYPRPSTATRLMAPHRNRRSNHKTRYRLGSLQGVDKCSLWRLLDNAPGPSARLTTINFISDRASIRALPSSRSPLLALLCLVTFELYNSRLRVTCSPTLCRTWRGEIGTVSTLNVTMERYMSYQCHTFLCKTHILRVPKTSKQNTKDTK